MLPSRYHILPSGDMWHVCDRRRGDNIVAGFKTRRGARDYIRKLNTEQDKFDLLQEAQKAESFDPTLSPYKE